MIDRLKFVVLLGASVAAFKSALYAQDHGNGHGHGHDDDGDNGKHGDHEDRGERGEQGNGDHGNKHNRYFRQEDYGTVARYYGGPRDLPPGLAKKYYRSGTLPPGWQKRYQPFPPQLVAQLPPPPPNCSRGFIDGQAIVYNRSTRVIVDVLDIAATIGSR